MEYQVKTRSVRIRRFVESIMPSIIDQLGLKNSRRYVMIEIGRSAGVGNEGITVPLPELDSYVISIKLDRLADVGVTLAHEMVHVRQLALGILRLERGRRYWCGRRVPNQVAYLDTPWERDAFARQELIFRKAVQV